jgi:DNA-binding transcriptional LysR family regulator
VSLYRNLAERNVELVMAATSGVIPAELSSEHLFDDSLVVAAGVQHPWTRRRKIELAELVNEPWTLPPPDSDPGVLAMEAFRASGLEPPRARRSSPSRSTCASGC